MTGSPLLRMEGVCKSFPGVTALSDVDFDVMPGEVHALLGENGAGKSTLIKILMGVTQRDSGRILLGCEAVEIRSPLRAQALGLAAVYQDVMLARHLSVGENFFMGRLPRRRGLVDWAQVHRETDAFLSSLGLHIDPRTRVGDLTVARQQLVAIAKVVWIGARVIVFDEPTALLTTSETDILFGIIARLKAENKAIIYISHRLEEIFKVCDRATVLRDGSRVGCVDVAGATEDALVSMMVGRTIAQAFPHRKSNPGETVLEVRNLGAADRLKDISFELRRGEILGMYGLVGAGRTELLRVLFGADPFDKGEILLEGKRTAPRAPDDMIGRGFALLCEDRKHQSLALPLDVRTNINLARYRRSSRFGFIDGGDERTTAQRFILALKIRTPSPYQTVVNSQRRQPAESRDRQMARHRTPDPVLRRADHGRRCRRAHRDLHADAGPRGGRQGDRHGLVLPAGSARPRRPHLGDARGPAHRHRAAFAGRRGTAAAHGLGPRARVTSSGAREAGQ